MFYGLVHNVNSSVKLLSLCYVYFRCILFNFCYHVMASEVIHNICSLTRDIDIAIVPVCPSVRLSVRNAPVSDENGLTYCHSFFTIR